MKIIKDSGKVHWAIGVKVTCVQCESIYLLETLEDFKINTGYNVMSTCPVCSYKASVAKPIKIVMQPPYIPQGEPWDGLKDFPRVTTILT